MKAKELAKLLMKHPNLEVTITDGWEARCYTTKKIEVNVCEDEDGSEILDFGVGGNEIKE